MTLKTFLTINAVIGTATGLAFLLLPEKSLLFAGITADETSELFTRLLGAEFIALNWLTWLLRNSDYSSVLRLLLKVRSVTENCGFIILLIPILTGSGNEKLWMLALPYLIFGLGYVYFFLTAPKETVK